MNNTCAPQKRYLKNAFGGFLRSAALIFLAFSLPVLGNAQFSLDFPCEENRSIEVTMKGTVDSLQATMMVMGDTSLVDSILVELAVKGLPNFWGSTTITTSAGEVIVVPFPGLITNTGSNEEAAIYRAWVGPASKITATTPVIDVNHYDDWQSMTLNTVQRGQDCVSGSTSGGDLLIFHACDSLYFDIDTITGPTQDISVVIPISELGDVDTNRIAIICINYIHNNVITNVFKDTFNGSDNTDGSNALLYERFFQAPGNVDSVFILVNSPNSVFPPFNSCTNAPPFGGDSFIIGTVVVSSSCDQCCTVEAECNMMDIQVCAFDSIPAIPDELLDSIPTFAGNTNLDSLAFIAAGGTYLPTQCDTIYIIASDAAVGGGCGTDTGFVTRTYIFFNSYSDLPVDTCSQLFIVVDDIPPTINCPADLTLECPAITDTSVTGVATASDDCSTAMVTYVDVIMPGACPQEYTITRNWIAEDACGNTGTCVQTIVVEDNTPPSISCPADILLECTDPTDPMTTGFPIVLDACDSAPFVTYSDAVTPGLCPQQFTINRTWLAQDACGNVATCLQTINVDDSTPPVISCPVDVTVECTDNTDPMLTGTATATDNCSAPSVTYADMITPGGCPEEYTITRTWTAEDDCGNTSTCVQTIEVVDTVAPVIIPPADATVQCIEDVMFADPVVTDNCSAFTVTYADMSGNAVTGTLEGAQEVPPVMTLGAGTVVGAYDAATMMFFIHVEFSGLTGNTTASHIHGPAMPGQNAGVILPLPIPLGVSSGSFDYATTLTAPQAQQLEDTLWYVNIHTNAFPGGELRAQLTLSDWNVLIKRTWTATDTCGNSSTAFSTVLVSDTIPPVIACPADLTLECTESTDPADTGIATATDNCSVPLITYAESIEPGACPQQYTIFRNWTATDECGNQSSCLQTIFVDDTMPPSITCPADLMLECTESTDTSNTGVATGTDNCGLVSISFADVVTPGGCPFEYTIARTWTAADECGNSVTCVQTISVDDTTPPVISCPVDLTLECFSSTDPADTGFATAADNCDTAPTITYSDVTLPGDCFYEVNITRTWIAADICGNISTCIQSIIVEDQLPPEISCPADVTVSCNPFFDPADPEGTGFPFVVDNCDSAPFVTYADNIIPGGCPQAYTVTRTWTAADICGNVASCIQTIVVEDTEAPQLTTIPADITVECGDDIPVGMAGAIDNCSDTIVVTFVDLICDVSTEGFTGDYDFANWTAFEPNGGFVLTSGDSLVVLSGPEGVPCENLATTFSITVPEDGKIVFGWDYETEDGPFFDPFGYSVNGVFAKLTLDNGPDSQSGLGVAVVSAGDVFAFEQRSTDCVFGEGVSTVIDFFVYTCDENGIPADSCDFTIFRCYNATDECGNTGYGLQQIRVVDTTPPAIVCPVDVTINCDEDTDPANTGTATATDICNDFTITYSDVVTPGNCPQEMTIARTWFAEDVCNNVSSCVQTISVVDDDAPVVTCPPGITVECEEDLPACPADIAAFIALGGSVTDNCDTDVLMACSAGPLVGGGCGGTAIYTFTFSDDCGNSSTCTWIVTVDDNTAPMIVCPPDVTLLEGDSSDPANTGTATGTDNCDDPEIEFTDVETFGECEEQIIIERTWTATDACGNTATCLQIIFYDIECVCELTCPDDITINLDPGACTAVVDFPDPEFMGGICPMTIQEPATLTQNTNTTLIQDALQCGVNPTSHWRAYDLAAMGVVGDFSMQSLGMASWSAGTVQIFVYTYTGTLPSNTLDVAQMTLVGQSNAMGVGGFSLTTHPLLADAVIPEGSKFVVEQRQLAGGPWCIASNYAGNTQPAYMNCIGSPFGFPAIPTSYNDLGYGFIHPIQVLNGVTIQEGGLLVQVSGLPSGSEFPIGTTTNCFHLIDAQTQEIVDSCCFDVVVNEYPFSIQPSCNDLVQISLDGDCEARICADVLLEGGPYGCYDDYLVYIDQFGFGNDINCESLNFTFGLHTVTIVDPETGNSCWGQVLIEDKLPPQITCQDFTLTCGQDLTPVFSPPIMGVNTCSVILSPGLPIGPNAGVVTTSTCTVSLPQGVEIVDVNVCVKITHTWIGDCNTDIIHPSGAVTNLWGFGQCNLTDNMHQKFDDDGPLTVLCADINNGCDFILQPVAQQLGTPSLDQYITENPNGVWTLMVTDNTNGDGGTLDEWHLEIEYAQNAPFAPTVSDNCDDNVDLVYNDVSTGETCDTVTILRTWTATDDSGNTAQCVQTLTVEPMSLAALECPENYIGFCGQSSDPDVTGWPTIDGVPITEGGVCNIFVGYWDQELADCGNGTKIVRRWSILDWCSQEVEECIQIIKLTDDQGPVLTCPANQTVGTDPWFCNKDVNLILPQAYDVCGTAFTMAPSISAGTLVHFGGSNYRGDDLPVGVTTVTWTATDACGNSSTCTYTITVVDDVPPVPICDEHTILTLTTDNGLHEGLTKIYATSLDDGSYDNCGPVTFLARRMNSCIDFDWIGPNGEYPNNDGGAPESIDQGLTFQPWVPFACCDVGNTIMVELRVTDLAGKINSCMVEVEVQDKLPPIVVCPPDITVSCDYWFDAHETNGFEPTDGLESIFGEVLDAYDYDDSDRDDIIINDPGNTSVSQPRNWGRDGWADDNCDVTIDVRTRLFDDCSGDDLPSGAPNWAVRLVERTFRAQDGQGNTTTCRQRIWVVDFDPFYITDTQCGLNNADDVRWPCDLELTDCPQGPLTPENLSAYAPNNRPVVNDDNCSIIGMTYDDQIFYFVDNACYKIVRTWTVIDWCQFDPVEHTGYWTYVQVIKVFDHDGPEFLDCPDAPVTLCVANENVQLPANNQVFLGEEDPNSSACSVHVQMEQTVYETCSETVIYDVKIYQFNGTIFDQIVARTTVPVDSNGEARLTFDTRTNSLPSNHQIRRYGLPYNSNVCSNWPLSGGVKDYHRVLWSVEDGCGNLSSCEYLFRLEDCKKPSPVCVGLSSVVMPSSGCVTIWAKDFDASSFDDCTAHDDLLFSFSGTTYQPSREFCCEDIEENGSPSFLVEIWVGDEGNDQNCNGFVQPLGIEWSERNKDFCTTFIVLDDNEGVCGDSLIGGLVETEDNDAVEKVKVNLTDVHGQVVTYYVTDKNGLYHFINPLFDYTMAPERDDNHKNGVSTLDLVAIQKHLLGIQEITSPYKLIAADANNSESVSAVDLVEIRKLILGLYTEFPKNSSWRFVDGKFVFDDPTQPWPFDEMIASHGGMTMQEDFVGVKVGDVNGTVVANATQIVTRGARSTLNLRTEDREVRKGEGLAIEVTADEYSEMLGFQLTIDMQGLEFTGIEGNALQIPGEYVGVHQNAITMSWGDVLPISIDQDKSLFTLHFLATGSGKLSEMLQITSAITEAEAYSATSEDVELMDVALLFGMRPTTAGNTEFALYQNEPNPFVDHTVIGFDLPVAMEATVTVYDLTGRAVHVIEGEYAQGYNQIVLRHKELKSAGAYYYRLDAGDFTASKKMILTQ